MKQSPFYSLIFRRKFNSWYETEGTELLGIGGVRDMLINLNLGGLPPKQIGVGVTSDHRKESK